MGLGGGPQAHRRAADRDQHLLAHRVPGLHPGRPHRRLGVLAAVAAGLYTEAGRIDALTHLPLRSSGFWEALTFLLESVLFLLIGLELPHITRRSVREKPLLYSAAVLVTLIAIRMAGMFTVPLLAQLARGAPPNAAGIAPRGTYRSRLERDARRRVARSRARATLCRGRPFPDRANVIFISDITIAATLASRD